MIQPAFEILNQRGTPMFFSDIFANRPNFGIVGRIFISTDTSEIYRDTGNSWVLIADTSAGGTITGSGTAGTLPIWTSSSALGNSIITGTSSSINITGSNSRLAIGGTDDGSSQLQTYFDGNTRLKFVAASNVATDDADITGFRARGTNASKLAIQSGDSITNYSGRGYDGTNFAGGGGFDIFAAENYSVGNNGTYISVQTTPIGSANITYFHRFSANGGFHVGSNSNPITGYTFQTTGKAYILDNTTYSTGTIQSQTIDKQLTIPNAASISSSVTLSSLLVGGTTTFQGSVTIPNTTTLATNLVSNSFSFSSAGTITMTQAAGIRAASSNQILSYFSGTASSTISHYAAQSIYGFFNIDSGSITPVIQNAYMLLINDMNDYSHTFTLNNRWGIYQAGTSDKNYFAGNILLGSVVDNGSRLQVTGAATISSSVTATSFISDGGASEGSIRIERDTVGTSTVIGSLNFTNNNGATTYGKVFGGRNSAGDGYVALGTSVSNNLYAVESGGNVGIGTTTPSQKLEVAGTIRGEVVNVYGSTDPTITSPYLYSPSTGALGIGANGSERIRLSSSGNLSVGTSTDSGQKLYLNGSLRIDGQTSGSSGGSSGQHLIVNCDGTTYKIKLENV